MLFQSALVLGSLFGAAVADLYTLSQTIPWAPATPASVDQSVVYNNTYYLADRTNSGIHVVNLTSGTQTTLIPGFITGKVNGTLTSSISGPDGMVVLPNRNELWVGDGDGTVKVIDLFTNKIVANITTGSKKRADEFAYNPTSGMVVVTNPSDTIPFVTFINSTSRMVVGKFVFTEAGGLEQPAFNPADSKFYISVPDTPAYPGGVVSVLDAASANPTISKNISTPDCDNAGIVFAGSTNLLFVSCSSTQITTYSFSRSFIYNVTTGMRVANVSGVSGVDQVAYSDFTKYFYASAYQNMANGAPAPSVAVIAMNGTVLQTITTDNSTAHAVAVNPKDGSMIVPVKAKGILVYKLGGSASSTPTSTGAASTGTSASAGCRKDVAVGMLGAVAAAVAFALVL